MTDQQRPGDDPRPNDDPTFKRHGPEPPENDSGPTPSIDEIDREQRGGNAVAAARSLRRKTP